MSLLNFTAHTSIVCIVGNKPKGRISKRVFQENKASQIFRKTNVSYPLIRIKGLQNVRFLENLTCFVLLKNPFWNSLFWLITDGIVTVKFPGRQWNLWSHIRNLSDSNGFQIHNHIVSTRSLNYLDKLANLTKCGAFAYELSGYRFERFFSHLNHIYSIQTYYLVFLP